MKSTAAPPFDPTASNDPSFPPPSVDGGRARATVAQAIFVGSLALAAAIGCVVVLVFASETRLMAGAAAQAMMARGAEALRLRTEALIQPAAAAVNHSLHWAGVETPPTADGHPARPAMARMLAELPQLHAFYVGYADGAFYHVVRDGAGGLTERVHLPGDDGTQVRSRSLSAAGRPFGPVEVSRGDFDPRTRPWWTMAREAGGLARTEPYRFKSSGVVGLSIARPAGEAVVGADITLGALEEFLSAEPEAARGVLAILHPDGGVIARSRPAADSTPAEARRVEVALERLVSHAAEDPSLAKTLKIDGENWIARAASVGFGGGREVLLIAQPAADVYGPVVDATRGAALWGAVIAVGFVPILFVLSRRLSRPILALAREADAIRRFELTDPAHPSSRLSEIGRLESAMALARENLRIFSLYVPKALVRQLIDRQVEPSVGGERREITVLFLDLQNFTPMSAGLAPEDLTARMSDFFEIVTKVLLRREATIDKFIGDAVMAFWNAPADVPDHELQAVRAALEIVAEVRPLTNAWASADPDAPHVKVRIGLHCGPAVVGNVGSSDRLNYTALGETVNLAARLEGLTREVDADVLISPHLAERVRGRVQLRSAGKVTPKGYTEPIPVFEPQPGGLAVADDVA